MTDSQSYGNARSYFRVQGTMPQPNPVPKQDESDHRRNDMGNAEIQLASLRRPIAADKAVAASSPRGPLSRRSVLAGGAAIGAGLFIGRMAGAQSVKGSADHPLKEDDSATNDITLHVTEQG